MLDKFVYQFKEFLLIKKFKMTFIDKFLKETNKLKVGDPFKKDTVVGPLIRNSELKRVDSWVNESCQTNQNLFWVGKNF